MTSYLISMNLHQVINAEHIKALRVHLIKSYSQSARAIDTLQMYSLSKSLGFTSIAKVLRLISTDRNLKRLWSGFRNNM